MFWVFLSYRRQTRCIGVPHYPTHFGSHLVNWDLVTLLKWMLPPEEYCTLSSIRFRRVYTNEYREDASLLKGFCGEVPQVPEGINSQLVQPDGDDGAVGHCSELSSPLLPTKGNLQETGVLCHYCALTTRSCAR